MKQIVALVSAVTGLVTLGVFWITWVKTGDVVLARSVAFALLGTATLVYVFSIRSLSKPIWQVNPLSNPWLILAVGLLIIAVIEAVKSISSRRLK